MAAQNMPAAEVEITADLVRALLAEQFPHLTARPLTLVANGWDNTIFRLGDDLLVRMPRRSISADLVEHEHRWLPELAARLPIPICAPLHRGRPGCGFPWSWSVCPWFDGDVAADVVLADPAREAERLGAFVNALHRPAPADAPYNEFRRGKPIAEFIPRIETNLASLETSPDPVHPGPVPARTRFAPVHDRLAQLADVAEWDGPAALGARRSALGEPHRRRRLDLGRHRLRRHHRGRSGRRPRRRVDAVRRREPGGLPRAPPDRSTTRRGSAGSSGPCISPCCTCCTPPTASASTAWARPSSPPCSPDRSTRSTR